MYFSHGAATAIGCERKDAPIRWTATGFSSFFPWRNRMHLRPLLPVLVEGKKKVHSCVRCYTELIRPNLCTSSGPYSNRTACKTIALVLKLQDALVPTFTGTNSLNCHHCSCL